MPDISEQLHPCDREFLNQLRVVIFELMDSFDLSAERVSSRLCMTSQQLRRRIHAILGIKVSAYIAGVRMEFAERLLDEERQLTIAEVARCCGFEEPGNFTRFFRQQKGMSPSEFRAQCPYRPFAQAQST